MSQMISGSVYIVGPSGELVLAKDALAVALTADSQTTNERVLRQMQEERDAELDTRGVRSINQQSDTRGRR